METVCYLDISALSLLIALMLFIALLWTRFEMKIQLGFIFALVSPVYMIITLELSIIT